MWLVWCQVDISFLGGRGARLLLMTTKLGLVVVRTHRAGW